MRPVQVHKPIRMNLHDLHSRMNCILIVNTPGAVICLLQVAPKWFSGPDILNFKAFLFKLAQILLWGISSKGFIAIVCLKMIWGVKIPKEKVFFSLF